MDIKQIGQNFLSGTKVKLLEGFSITGRVEEADGGKRLIVETHIKSSVDFPGEMLEEAIAAVLQIGNFRTPSAP